MTIIEERTTFTLASRKSQLAQIQTIFVKDTLTKSFPSKTFDTLFMSTEGDKNQSEALYLLGGKALWTKDLEVSLAEGKVDLLVHCLKDVPTTLPDGFEIGAIMEREDPVDSLVVKVGLPYRTLEELPDGSVVGTSSVRRVAQLKTISSADIHRFGKNTRFAKLDNPDGPYTAIVLAKAGIVRMGWAHRISSDIPAPTLYNAVGQGALGIEIRSSDEAAKKLCETLTHWRTDWTCRAERAMLRVLEGGCSVPVGVQTNLEPLEDDGPGKSRLKMTGCVTALDGSVHVEETFDKVIASRVDAEVVGFMLAKTLLANGAKPILDDINKDRETKVAAVTVSGS